MCDRHGREVSSGRPEHPGSGVQILDRGPHTDVVAGPGEVVSIGQHLGHHLPAMLVEYGINFEKLFLYDLVTSGTTLSEARRTEEPSVACTMEESLKSGTPGL